MTEKGEDAAPASRLKATSSTLTTPRRCRLQKHTTGGISATRRSERHDNSLPRGVSRRKPIDAAKEMVPVPALAEHLSGPGVRRGKEMLFLCPLHDDHNPSLRVDPAKGLWHCAPCSLGGDVVTLACLAWGYDHREGRSAAEAAAMLLMEFGHEPPQRPQSWFRKQERQREVRGRAYRARVEHVAMLVFRLVWMPWLRRLPECVRDEAKERAWKDSLWMADRLYSSRRLA